MALIIVENVRGFFTSRPPLVLFMICLASFAIALITFAYVVRIKDMPNPDVSEDWNTILTKFSGLEFCVTGGATPPSSTAQPANTSNSSPSVPAKPKIGDQHLADVLQNIHDNIKGGKFLSSSNDKPSQAPTPFIPSKTPESRVVKRDANRQKTSVSTKQVLGWTGGSRNDMQALSVSASLVHNWTRSVTIPLNMEIAPNEELQVMSLQLVHLVAEVSGRLLKLNGPAKQENLHISMRFPMNLTKENCREWEGKECTLYVINTCVTFSGPASVFPPTQRPASSAVCERERFAIALPDSYHLLNMTATELTVSGSWCAGGSRLTAEFSFDEALTVMLSQQDRSIINMHLMRTSYFLFVMVITLFCYAMIKGRPAKAKAVHVSYEKVATNVP